VDSLGGAPGVHSARYAADQPHLLTNNTDDQANNARLLRELRKILPDNRTGIEGLYLAGEYSQSSSIQGAMHSGEYAAKAVLKAAIHA